MSLSIIFDQLPDRKFDSRRIAYKRRNEVAPYFERMQERTCLAPKTVPLKQPEYGTNTHIRLRGRDPTAIRRMYLRHLFKHHFNDTRFVDCH